MTEHTVCLSDAEARRLAETGALLVVRPVVPQPKWSENEPDRITDVAGGFVDGVGVSHTAILGAPSDVLVCKEAFGGAPELVYRATEPSANVNPYGGWAAASTMPQGAVRFRPVVCEAGVMRIDDITYGQCIDMGLDMSGVEYEPGWDTAPLVRYWNRRFRKYPWESNPWVWTAVVETPEKAARDEWAQREADKRRAMLEDMWWEEQNA